MDQKTVLITGCSEGGIGDALAKAFHKRGLRVFATARNLAKIEHLKAIGLDVLALDVVDDESIKNAVESVKVATGGTLDILVNNSGAGYNVPLLDTDISMAKKMFDVNVFALIAVTQAFSPLLIAAKGTIVNIGSIAGKFQVPWQGNYNASKAAVQMLTDQFRAELKPFDVKAINVITGAIKTKFFDNIPSVILSPGSLYYPAREEIEAIAQGALVEKDGTDVDVYAKAVAANALKKNPTVNHWVGSSSFTIWFVGAFFPHSIWDFFLSLPGPFNMPQITRKIKEADKSK